MTNSELEQCIEAFGKDIYSFCIKLTGNREEADELYQDTFLKALEQREKLDMCGNPKSYLLSVAIRLWKNKRRKAAWRKRILKEQGLLEEGRQFTKGLDSGLSPDTENFFFAKQEAGPEEWVLEQEKLRLLQKCVDCLPQRQKIIVLLYYMEELSISQIGLALRIPEGTVKSRLFQARKKLQKEMEAAFYGK